MCLVIVVVGFTTSLVILNRKALIRSRTGTRYWRPCRPPNQQCCHFALGAFGGGASSLLLLSTYLGRTVGVREDPGKGMGCLDGGWV